MRIALAFAYVVLVQLLDFVLQLGDCAFEVGVFVALFLQRFVAVVQKLVLFVERVFETDNLYAQRFHLCPQLFAG